MRTAIFIAALALALALAVAAVVSHGALVTKIPGLTGPAPPSKMYSGYVPVADGRRSIFYLFVESEKDPKHAPVSLWQTGGPGVASTDAVLSENSPLRTTFFGHGAEVRYNKWTWTQISNVIWVDSPAGVGFSYSTNKTDYTDTTDKRTADDLHDFLLGFFALPEFAHLKQNPLNLIGESYGGHYVPSLAEVIMQRNRAGNPATRLNLRGWSVGNPWTNPVTEAWGVVEKWWTRSIISADVYRDIKAFCDYKLITDWIIVNVTAGSSAARQTLAGGDLSPQVQEKRRKRFERLIRDGGAKAEKCFAALKKGSIDQFGDIDILNIDADICREGTVQLPGELYNPCANNDITAYWNRADVWEAFHIDAATVPGGRWSAANMEVNIDYSVADTQSSKLPIYQEAIAAGKYEIMVYSGQADSIVPDTATQTWIYDLAADMNMTVASDFHSWFARTNGRQVGGWAIQWKGAAGGSLTFATVRGAGHMVPYAKPQRASVLINAYFLNGTI